METKCCKSGEFTCEVPILYPLGCNRLIFVDRCIAPELQSLWLRGIETGGCCCGHFEKDGFIQVFPDYIDAMRELGYEEIPPVEVYGQLMGKNAFKPKTKFEFNGYIDAKSELMCRYEKLKTTASEMLGFIGMSANLKTPCDLDVYCSLAKQLNDAVGDNS